MLKPSQEGLLVGKLTEFLANVSPTSYEYGAARPDEETTFVFGRLVGGMGEQIQSSASSKRYRYANAVDCSIAGTMRLGPLFAAASLPAPPGADAVVRQFIAGPAPGGDRVYCLRGQAVYVLLAGVWTLSKDFGALNLPLQAVVYRGTVGPRRLLVTTGLGELWGYDGTTWTLGLTGTGPPPYLAQYCAVVGRELYIGMNETVRVGDTGDPLAPGGAFFGGAIQVGQTGTAITYLAALSSTLYVFKSDGVFTLNADGSDNDLFPELRADPRSDNGLNAHPWRDALYVRYGDAYYRLSADAALEPIGPERLVENTSPVRGLAVAGTSHADWFLYLGTYAAASGHSFLWKYGTWTPSEGGSQPAAYHFDEVWNGAVAVWQSRRLSRVDAVTLAGEPTLWVGFYDGGVESTALPAATPDPTQDARCRFIDRGQIVWPLHDAVFGADRKAWHGLTVLGPALSTEQSVRQYWRVDPAVLHARLTPDFTRNGQRVEFPDLTTGAARDTATGLQLDTYTELRTTDPTKTPVLEGVALHEAVRPAAGDPVPRLSLTATVRAGNRVVRRDGVVSRVSAEAILALCRTAATSAGHIRVRGPDGVVVAVAAIEYVQSLAPENGRDGLEHDVSLRLVQFR